MENKAEALRKTMGLNQDAFAISDFFGLPIEEIFIYERSGKHERT